MCSLSHADRTVELATLRYCGVLTSNAPRQRKLAPHTALPFVAPLPWPQGVPWDVSTHLNTLEGNYDLMRQGDTVFRRLTRIQMQLSFYLPALLRDVRLRMAGGPAAVGAAGA